MGSRLHILQGANRAATIVSLARRTGKRSTITQESCSPGHINALPEACGSKDDCVWRVLEAFE